MKNGNTKFYILIAILVILVLLLGGYIVYDKQIKKEEMPKTSETNKETETEKENTEETFVSKQDESKDWVYDAEYEKNVLADSYKTYYNKTLYARDIVVPYINIESSYAIKANKEIKKIFNTVIEKYNEGVNDKTTFVDTCEYEKYFQNNVLSVIFNYGIGATDVVNPNYYSYNIDLKTGEELSFEDIYKIAGFNESNINEKVENAITTIVKERTSDLTEDNYSDGTNFDTFNNASLTNYKNSVMNNTLEYFLSNNNKLNIVVKLILPFGSEDFNTIITID